MDLGERSGSLLNDRFHLLLTGILLAQYNNVEGCYLKVLLYRNIII